MTGRDTPPPDRNAAGVAAYSLWCMTSLVAMTVGLMLRSGDLGMLAPMFFGGVSLLFRWRLGPIIVLSALVILYVSWWFGVNPLQLAWNNTFGLILSVFTRGHWQLEDRQFSVSREPRPVSDLLMTLGYLSYAAGNYRLLGMTVRIFPHDPRRRPAPVSDRRPPVAVTRGEVIGFVLALLGCVTLAAVLVSWSDAPGPPWNHAPILGNPPWRPGPLPWKVLPFVWLFRVLALMLDEWQFVFLLWVLGASAVVVAGVLRTLAARRMTRDEALLLLQDVVWNETRGEQRRLNRWLTWSWLRRRRREDRT